MRKLKPLIQIHEEPKSADDLVFVVDISESSSSLSANMPKEKIGRFLSSDADSIAEFLRMERNVARPVHLSLAYYGRQKFGEE